MALSMIFPGTAWIDPGFANGWPRPRGLNPQQLVSSVLIGLLAIAVFLATR